MRSTNIQQPKSHDIEKILLSCRHEGRIIHNLKVFKIVEKWAENEKNLPEQKDIRFEIKNRKGFKHLQFLGKSKNIIFEEKIKTAFTDYKMVWFAGFLEACGKFTIIDILRNKMEFKVTLTDTDLNRLLIYDLKRLIGGVVHTKDNLLLLTINELNGIHRIKDLFYLINGPFTRKFHRDLLGITAITFTRNITEFAQTRRLSSRTRSSIKHGREIDATHWIWFSGYLEAKGIFSNSTVSLGDTYFRQDHGSDWGLVSEYINPETSPKKIKELSVYKKTINVLTIELDSCLDDIDKSFIYLITKNLLDEKCYIYKDKDSILVMADCFKDGVNLYDNKYMYYLFTEILPLKGQKLLDLKRLKI